MIQIPNKIQVVRNVKKKSITYFMNSLKNIPLNVGYTICTSHCEKIKICLKMQKMQFRKKVISHR